MQIKPIRLQKRNCSCELKREGDSFKQFIPAGFYSAKTTTMKNLLLYISCFILLLHFSASAQVYPLKPGNGTKMDSQKVKPQLKPGCVGGNCKKGRGTYIYTNADTFSGHFDNGYRNGPGVLKFAGGGVLSGEFRHDTIRGIASMRYANGDIYSGYMKDNQTRSGFGTLFSHDSTRYVGEWKDDKPNGRGTRYLTQGDIISGEFEDGRIKKIIPYVWNADDTTGDAAMCKAFRTIVAAMRGRFAQIKGSQWQNEHGTQWMPLAVIPGALHAYISNIDTISSECYFEILQHASYADAQTAYEALKNKMKICKTSDWVITQNDVMSPGQDIMVVLAGNKRPKNSAVPGFVNEIRCIKEPNNTYSVVVRFIAYAK
jgi:hypothetical protein